MYINLGMLRVILGTYVLDQAINHKPGGAICQAIHKSYVCQTHRLVLTHMLVI